MDYKQLNEIEYSAEQWGTQLKKKNSNECKFQLLYLRLN